MTPGDVTFCVSPREGCKFMTAGISNHHNWREQFFFLKDNGWGVPIVWCSKKTQIKPE